MSKSTPYRVYNGTIFFFIVDRIKEMESSIAYQCLVQLNKVVSESALVAALGKGWTGSTISGLFVLIPDESNLLPDEHLVPLFAQLAVAGVPIRCGVTWGPILCFEDVDGTQNFVGRAINVAARLAYSPTNPGCLVHDKYEAYAAGFVRARDGNVLNGAQTQLVKGKKHDGEGFLCRVLGEDRLAMLPSRAAAVDMDVLRTEGFSSGLVLAYDLPQFSEGDESQLSKRVRSLVDSLRGLIENRSALRNAKLYFCPGGDGGVLVISSVRAEASELATALARILVVESEYKGASIAVEARIGVHYGAITLYEDSGGRLRPTGPTCFLAEDLVSDTASRAAGLVFSESLSDVFSHGSDSFLSTKFTQLPVLTTGPAAGVNRYTPKGASKESAIHPLIQQLFGPISSWQPDSES